jgi:adenine-specific DNA-methyltransferase
MTENYGMKESLLAEIDQRVTDHVLEPTNAELLKKLIRQADDDNEAIMIAALGTTYKKTGFHFDKRLEKMSNTIRYFKKNEQLSFHRDKGKPVNKLIIGDNYEALQNLLIEYKERVDVIYIDPPYGKDSMGEFAQTNYENAITRDNLLSMLYPRLMLAKQLLTESGVIFCSIDDKNQAYIKCLFDEVFEERNSTGMILWQKKDKPSFLSSYYGSRFEYILCYAKNYAQSFPFSLETTTIGKKYPLNNAGNSLSILTFRAGSVSFNLPDGIVKRQDMSEGNIKTILLDDVIIKEGKNVNEFRLQGEFRYSQETLKDIMDNKESLYIAKIPFRPNHIKDGGEIKKMENLLSKKFSYDCETNEDATNMLISIFGYCPFDNPKPVGLLKLLLQATTYDNKDSIVLDFFAGSGTTGHAVLALNEQDKGNRQFILCQLNEVTDTTPNGIAYDVTSKRLKRIMTGECYDGTKNFKWAEENLPYGGNLDVYEIASVNNSNAIEGQTPFDVIDETLYGKEKFKTLREKIDWVCNNFAHTQKWIDDNDWWDKHKMED